MNHQTKKSKQIINRTLLIPAISFGVSFSAYSATFEVTTSLDDGTGIQLNSLSWAILQANESPGYDEIILKTNVVLNGVMKRLVDSDMTIKSDDVRRSINGLDLYRPFFIKSGFVQIIGIDINNGVAKGGDGINGGAGMGGGMFIYSGHVHIDDVSFNASNAIGGLKSGADGGGGGMYGDGNIVYLPEGAGGGGLFESASNSLGGDGVPDNYVYNNFGKGGDEGDDGGFGGGGGRDDSTFGGVDGGYGGFGGGGGGYAVTGNEGLGGFGGGSGDSPGFGAGVNGAGMGGALFIRSGEVLIANSEFNQGLASAEGGGDGLGGGIFVLHSITNSNNNNQGMPQSLANVTICNLVFL
ncbi:MAG: hypothetical protein ACSHWU_10665, partial [Marinicella sp.]